MQEFLAFVAGVMQVDPSELSGETSDVVSASCIYDPTHDYSLDY